MELLNVVHYAVIKFTDSGNSALRITDFTGCAFNNLCSFIIPAQFNIQLLILNEI